MDNSTTTLEGDLLLFNQLELVTPTTVAGTLYGIAFTLFCLYVQALVPRLHHGDRKRQAKFMLVYSTIIMICGLYSFVSNAWVAQNAYIKHANTPGGPSSYEVTTYRAPHIIVGFTCQVVIDILTSAIQIWRVWVIWSATRYAPFVIVLPFLCFLTLTGLLLRGVILEATLSFAQLRQLDARTQIAENSIQGATTVLCTVLIAALLIFEHWHQRKLIGEEVIQIQ